MVISVLLLQHLKSLSSPSLKKPKLILVLVLLQALVLFSFSGPMLHHRESLSLAWVFKSGQFKHSSDFKAISSARSMEKKLVNK